MSVFKVRLVVGFKVKASFLVENSEPVAERVSSEAEDCSGLGWGFG